MSFIRNTEMSVLEAVLTNTFVMSARLFEKQSSEKDLSLGLTLINRLKLFNKSWMMP